MFTSEKKSESKEFFVFYSVKQAARWLFI